MLGRALGGMLGGTLGGAFGGALGSPLGGALGSPLEGALGSPVGGALGSPLGGALGSPPARRLHWEARSEARLALRPAQECIDDPERDPFSEWIACGMVPTASVGNTHDKETRWLPPTNLAEIFDQYCFTCEAENPASYSIFKAVYKKEFRGTLRIRHRTQHSRCAEWSVRSSPSGAKRPRRTRRGISWSWRGRRT